MNAYADGYLIFVIFLLIFVVMVTLTLIGLSVWAIYWFATKDSRAAASEERVARIKDQAVHNAQPGA